jgi:branched-subunit amino acid transport protein
MNLSTPVTSETDGWTLLVILGLTAVSMLTRSFFFISSQPWHLPRWVQRGLQYAPIAALSAVVLPEIVMSHGHLLATWQDARLFAAAVGAGYFFWRKDVLGTIISGMAVYLPLHLALGW